MQSFINFIMQTLQIKFELVLRGFKPHYSWLIHKISLWLLAVIARLPVLFGSSVVRRATQVVPRGRRWNNRLACYGIWCKSEKWPSANVPVDVSQSTLVDELYCFCRKRTFTTRGFIEKSGLAKKIKSSRWTNRNITNNF